MAAGSWWCTWDVHLGGAADGGHGQWQWRLRQQEVRPTGMPRGGSWQEEVGGVVSRLAGARGDDDVAAGGRGDHGWSAQSLGMKGAVQEREEGGQEGRRWSSEAGDEAGGRRRTGLGAALRVRECVAARGD